MEIQVCSSHGSGVTRKTAFDSALEKINLNQYNIIEYSSVIPPEADIMVTDRVTLEDASIGDVLGVVIDEGFERDGQAEARLVWETSENGGWFLETGGQEVSEAEVSMMRDNRPSAQLEGDVNSEYASAESESEWTCAIVVAVYERVEM